MRAVIFVVYLCFLLLKGFDHTYTGIHNGIAPVQQIEKAQQVKPIGAHKEEAYFISEEAEDQNEDESNTIAEKHRSILRYNVIPSHTYILNHFYSCFKGRLPYKYITQRTLRI